MSTGEYLKSDLNLTQFFMHFERMVNDKRYKELEAEYDLCYRLVNMKISGKMLIQAREVYTKTIFKEFQDQFEEAVELSITNCVIDGENFVYAIKMDDDSKERHVKREVGDKLSCSCGMIEMKGILCSHVIKVMREAMNIKEIPNQYILKRWAKQARAECVQDMNGREIQIDPKLQQTTRYRSLCSIFTRISSRASESEKAYNVAYTHASNLAKLVEDILRLEMDGDTHEKDHENNFLRQTKNTGMVCAQDVSITKAKGLKKKEASRGRRRIKSSLEKALAKKIKPTKPPSLSQAPINLLHVVDNITNPSMSFHPYYSELQLQDCNMSNPVSQTSYGETEEVNFQKLLLQNNMGFSFESQGFQASNNTMHVKYGC